MKFTCTQNDLAKGVSLVQRAVASRSTLAVLGNLLLEAKGGELRLAATDLSIAINGWVRADVVEEGAITVPARLLGDLIGKLPTGKVDLTTDPKTLSLHVACGNVRAKIAGIDAEQFPVTLMAREGGIDLDPKQLGEMIEMVTFVASRDQARQNLTCVQMQFGKRLTLAATDGVRLGVRSAPLFVPAPEQVVLVPATSLAELARILADADTDKPVVCTGDLRRIVFAVEGKESYLRVELSAQLVDAKYPDYAAIIPKSSTTSVAVESAALLRSLQRAALFAKGDYDAVTLIVEPGGCLKIGATDAIMGRSDDALDAEIKGKPVTIAVDVSFLIEVLGRLGSTQVVLELTVANRPISLRPFHASPDEFQHIIMPFIRGR